MLEVAGKHFDLFLKPTLGFDKLLHFLGGSVCGIFGFLVAESRLQRRSFIALDIVGANGLLWVWMSVLFFTITIGVGWEILQVYVPAMRHIGEYGWMDTIGDLIFDTMGGVVAGLVCQKKFA